MSSHECAAAGCSAQVSAGTLLCWSHWRRLRRTTQRDVNEAWRDLLRGVPGARATYGRVVATVVLSLCPPDLAGDPKAVAARQVLARGDRQPPA